MGWGKTLHFFIQSVQKTNDWIKTVAVMATKIYHSLTYNGGNDVSTFSQSFLIRSLSNLQVSRTGKSRTGLNSRQFTSKLRAIKHRKNSHTLIMGKWCLYASTFIIDRTFVKPADNQDSDKFEFRPDLTRHFGVTSPLDEHSVPATLTLQNRVKDRWTQSRYIHLSSNYFPCFDTCRS